MAGEYGMFFGERMPPGWLIPAVVFLGFLLALALILMLLVAGANFDDDPTIVPLTTPGSCEPFCTRPTSAPVVPR
ncbi:hypothetical protein NDR87_17585 [Nocardia sp. CDC159]|uniref:Uncharacterized protein n=1 Tax=Nocardia pulmonis TaxID=2951408 RepID=A0A9X2E8Y2_9NOCA|nr:MULTISPECIES: hypothetical protein [Nocardia]MCM6775851.1 hypothetical protein [Nocardia pulmonis]MCM6788173.1 hypothetical protein [Nocardia sp. CDC159]